MHRAIVTRIYNLRLEITSYSRAQLRSLPRARLSPFTKKKHRGNDLGLNVKPKNTPCFKHFLAAETSNQTTAKHTVLKSLKTENYGKYLSTL